MFTSKPFASPFILPDRRFTETTLANARRLFTKQKRKKNYSRIGSSGADTRYDPPARRSDGNLRGVELRPPPPPPFPPVIRRCPTGGILASRRLRRDDYAVAENGVSVRTCRGNKLAVAISFGIDPPRAAGATILIAPVENL
ncbi:hypothetical protein K0M31_004090 [Melipona bicolor]|uniref:Uncharacterized protein n=1 Tax=Melipona bicolor TaxID=60889 RepID=A0AA40KP43_9HYME|nr:hypothetical protein K0M31_004090 [Melipona bicolor]